MNLPEYDIRPEDEAANEAAEMRAIEREINEYNAREYDALLNLCAKLAHAYGLEPEPDEDGVWAAVEDIYEYVRRNHRNWQG